MGSELSSYLCEKDPEVTLFDVAFAWVGAYVVPLSMCMKSEDGAVKLRKNLKAKSRYDNKKQWTVETFEVTPTAKVLMHRRGSSKRLVVWFHGGGFTLGDAEDDYGQSLCAKLNVDFASVEYRLAPEAPFPAAVDDCKAALAWVLDKYKDEYTISVAGVSAGANLALAAILDNPTQHIHDVALLYPFLNPNCDSKSFKKHGHRANFDDWLRWCWQVYKSTDKNLLPFEGGTDKATYPDVPTMVVTSRADPLRDDGIALVEHLKASGLSNVTHVEGRSNHGLMHIVDTAGAKTMFHTWKHRLFGENTEGS